jgi:hypothetical protein
MRYLHTAKIRFRLLKKKYIAAFQVIIKARGDDTHIVPSLLLEVDDSTLITLVSRVKHVNQMKH